MGHNHDDAVDTGGVEFLCGDDVIDCMPFHVDDDSSCGVGGW